MATYRHCILDDYIDENKRYNITMMIYLASLHDDQHIDNRLPDYQSVLFSATATTRRSALSNIKKQIKYNVDLRNKLLTLPIDFTIKLNKQKEWVID